MVVTLYHYPLSARSRAAYLVACAAGIDADIQIVDITRNVQTTRDFIKINPQHGVPTLVDGDFMLCESRAISAYLVRTYAKDDSLYPEDLKQRAIVDRLLQFDCGTFYPAISTIFYPILFLGANEIHHGHRTNLKEALGFLDVFLDGNNFTCGNKLTIADCFLVASLTNVVATGWDISAYSNVKSWLARCSLEIPGYAKANPKGANAYAKLVQSKLLPGQL